MVFLWFGTFSGVIFNPSMQVSNAFVLQKLFIFVRFELHHIFKSP